MNLKDLSWARPLLIAYFGAFGIGILHLKFNIWTCTASWMLWMDVSLAPFLIAFDSYWSWKYGADAKITKLKMNPLTTPSKGEIDAIRFGMKTHAVTNVFITFGLLVVFAIFLSHGFQSFKESLFFCQ